MISQGTPQVSIFADPGNTQAIIFEAPSRLAKYQATEIWIGTMGSSNDWGSCNVFVSADGTTYKQVGTIDQPARLGTLDATFASGSDPDTVNSLVVDLAENSAPLESGSATDADQSNLLCYVDGELISYSACAASGQDQYTMGTYIRRGIFGTAVSSHAAGSAFLRLDDSVFQFDYDPTWANTTIFFKFQSVNTFGNAAQDLSAVTSVPFTIPGDATTQAPVSSSTVVINGDFELGSDLPPYGWLAPANFVGARGSLLGYDTGSPYQGSRSFLISAVAGFSMSVWSSQKYLVRPGDTYRLSGAMNPGVSSTGTQGRIQLVLYGVSDTDVKGSITLSLGHGSAVWTLQASNGAVPAGSTYARIVVTADATGSGGPNCTYEFDSIQLFRVPNLSSEVAGTLPIANVGARSGSIAYVIDGGGSAVTTGVKGHVSVPANCTVTGWVITADQSGSAVVDVLRGTYSGFPTVASIAGTDKPTLASAQKNQDSALSGWGSAALNAGDILQFSVSSATTVTRLTVTLNVAITG